MAYRSKKAVIDDIQAVCTSIAELTTKDDYKCMELEEILERLQKIQRSLTKTDIFVDLTKSKKGLGTLGSPLSFNQFNKKTTFGVVKPKGDKS